MRLIFKITGLLLIFISFSALGILKSLSLKKREERLKAYWSFLTLLSSKISAGEEFLKSALQNPSLVSFKNGKPEFQKAFLLKEDISVLSEFFGSFGMADRQSEYKRCLLYIKLLEKQKENAAENFKKLSKLYSSLGILSGIFICIILL